MLLLGLGTSGYLEILCFSVLGTLNPKTQLKLLFLLGFQVQYSVVASTTVGGLRCRAWG